MWPPVFQCLLASWLSLCCHQLPAWSTQVGTGKRVGGVVDEKKKLVPGIICQFRLPLNMRPLTFCKTRVHTESASPRLGLAGRSYNASPVQRTERGFFAQETRLLHITTSKSVCCTVCDCYLWFTHQSSESHGGIPLHKPCKLSSKLRIMTWFHTTLLTAENMTSYMGPPRAAFSPDWPHYENRKQSLCS